MSNTIEAVFGLNNPLYVDTIVSKDVHDPKLLYGLELEIEHASDFDAGPYFNRVEDGSLRNDGWEFVSVPMSYGNMQEVLVDFFKQNKPSPICYSERTSVHVHVNAQDMTMEQIASVMAIYQVFERVLYTFIGDERDKNIFCVPLSESAIAYNVCNNLTSHRAVDAVLDWSKYTALNLLPLSKLGTIEFRHMAGTDNVHRILQWLRIINCIFHVAKTKPYEEIKSMLFNLNTNSQYDLAMSRIFGRECAALACAGQTAMVEEGVLNFKYSMLTEVPVKKKFNMDEMRQQLRQQAVPFNWEPIYANLPPVQGDRADMLIMDDRENA